MKKEKEEKSKGMDTLEIVQGIAQALVRKGDGQEALYPDGKKEPKEIGLRREEYTPFTDRRIMDGFGVSIQGNILKLNYQSEVSLKEVYEKNFESKMTDILEQCVSYLKTEYRKVTKKTLGLKMVKEPIFRVEHMNKVRSWVIANCSYEITGIDKPKELSDDWEGRLNKKTRAFLGLDKKDEK